MWRRVLYILNSLERQFGFKVRFGWFVSRGARVYLITFRVNRLGGLVSLAGDEASGRIKVDFNVNCGQLL